MLGVIRETDGPTVQRYNYLLERIRLAEEEAARLQPRVEKYANEHQDLDWEYFRRLQLDGVLPRLVPVSDRKYTNYQEDDENERDGTSTSGENAGPNH